ncbi:MAG TPA: hypothetical protein VG297_10665, partial [Bryobacteraceae bacterium]|nr:hypothetical protein [Bryobacteraceae bacterium]
MESPDHPAARITEHDLWAGPQAMIVTTTNVPDQREKGKNMTRQNPNRRALLTGAAVAGAAAATLKTAKAADTPTKKVYRTGPKPATPPAYSTGISLGNLLFLSG